MLCRSVKLLPNSTTLTAEITVQISIDTTIWWSNSGVNVPSNLRAFAHANLAKPPSEKIITTKSQRHDWEYVKERYNYYSYNYVSLITMLQLAACDESSSSTFLIKIGFLTLTEVDTILHISENCCIVEIHLTRARCLPVHICTSRISLAEQKTLLFVSDFVQDEIRIFKGTQHFIRENCSLSCTCYVECINCNNYWNYKFGTDNKCPSRFDFHEGHNGCEQMLQKGDQWVELTVEFGSWVTYSSVTVQCSKESCKYWWLTLRSGSTQRSILAAALFMVTQERY